MIRLTRQYKVFDQIENPFTVAGITYVVALRTTDVGGFLFAALRTRQVSALIKVFQGISTNLTILGISTTVLTSTWSRSSATSGTYHHCVILGLKHIKHLL